MYIPLNITLKNYFCFSYLVFEFPQNFEIYQLKGKNGSGKSTILDAIPYALFGKMIKESITKEMIIKQGESDYLVSHEFSLDSVLYRIDRTFNSVHLFKQNEPFAYTNTQKEIDKILGIDFGMFQNAYYFGQETTPFRKLSNKDKELFFNVIFQDDKLDVLEKECVEQLAILNAEKAICQNGLETLNPVITNLKSNLGELNLRLQNEKDKLKSISYCAMKHSVLKGKYDNTFSVQEDINNKEIEKQLLETSFSELQIRLKDGQEIATQFLSIAIKSDVLIEKRIEKVDSEIAKLKAIKNGFICQICDVNFAAERTITEVEIAELKRFEGEKSTLISNLDFVRKYGSLEVVQNTLDKIYSEILNKTLSVKKYTAFIENAKTNLLSELDLKELNELQNAKNEIAMYNHSMLSISESITMIQESLVKSITKKVMLEAKLLGIVRNIFLYEFWKKGFGDKGLKRMKIESICSIINVRIKEICSILDIDMNIELVIDTEKVNKGFVILHNKRNCAASSGAEKNVIDLILFLVFNSITEQKFSFIILDEIFKNCTQELTEKMFSILEKIDYLTTYLISHRELDSQNVILLENQIITKNY
jgi:DNA repair exonuclease SbcCD ATPase subunit